MEVISVCHSDDCSSPVEGSRWHAASYESLFVLTLTRNMMERNTVCGRCSVLSPCRLARRTAGLDKAGLFCSHDVMANKAPLQAYNHIRYRRCHSPAPAPAIPGAAGHERGVMKVVGEVVFVSHFIHTHLPPLSPSGSQGVSYLLFFYTIHRLQ